MRYAVEHCSVREIQAHLQEMYGAEVSPSLISSVIDAVADEVKAWQSRPLDAICPMVYLDCIHTKVLEGAVRVKVVPADWSVLAAQAVLRFPAGDSQGHLHHQRHRVGEHESAQDD
jgi:transposase-like protein